MSWMDMEAELDQVGMDAFSEPVTLHLQSGDQRVKGVFSDQVEQVELKHGGTVSGADAELELFATDAAQLEYRTRVTVRGRKWSVLKTPVPAGATTVMVYLGVANEAQSGQPVIRY